MAITMHTMLLAAAVLVWGVAGNPPIFLYPPDGSENVYNKMDTVMVSYQASYDTVDLYTFCQPGVGKLIYQQKAPGFNATVPILLAFTSDTPCWFNVRQGVPSPDQEGTNGALFNVIGAERSTGPKVWGLDTVSSSTTTSSSTSAASTTIRSSTTSTAATTSPTDAGSGGGNRGSNTSNASTTLPTPSDTASSLSSSAGGSSDLSAGASAGIGIGAAIGVLALAGFAFLSWRRRRGRRFGAGVAAEMDGNNVYRHDGGYGGLGGYGRGGGGLGTAQGYGGAQKWQYGGELNAVHTPVEIANSGPLAGETGRIHHEMMG